MVYYPLLSCIRNLPEITKRLEIKETETMLRLRKRHHERHALQGRNKTLIPPFLLNILQRRQKRRDIMKFTEKQIRKLNHDDFMELFRVVMLEAWRRFIDE